MSAVKVPGNAKYKGDVRDEVLGNIMGPTTYGTLVTAFQAGYDEETDTTTVYFRNTTEDDYTA